MKHKKPINQITSFTTLDYPEHLACIVWFSGCNMRCKYCYNPDIVLENGNITIDELLLFLEKRKFRLDGVVLSGGECSMYSGLKTLCEDIKSLGFDIKMDTNGSNPKVLNSLIKNRLIDFVSLDFKAIKEKYFQVTLSKLYDDFIKSLDILIQNDFNFEVRSTLHSDLHNVNDINKMIELLHAKGYKGVYYLQNYLHVKTLGNMQPSKPLHVEDLSDILQIELRNF